MLKEHRCVIPEGKIVYGEGTSLPVLVLLWGEINILRALIFEAHSLQYTGGIVKFMTPYKQKIQELRFLEFLYNPIFTAASFYLSACIEAAARIPHTWAFLLHGWAVVHPNSACLRSLIPVTSKVLHFKAGTCMQSDNTPSLLAWGPECDLVLQVLIERYFQMFLNCYLWGFFTSWDVTHLISDLSGIIIKSSICKRYAFQNHWVELGLNFLLFFFTRVLQVKKVKLDRQDLLELVCQD